MIACISRNPKFFEKASYIAGTSIKILTNLIFPQFCINCDKFPELLCEDCTRTHRLNKSQRCATCDKRTVGGFTHKKCLKQTSIDRLIVVTKYESLERNLVYKLKYKNNRESAKIIAKLIERKIRNKIDFGEFIMCPIPLHKTRLRSRGYNQTERIATRLSEKISNINIQNLLIRKKNTKQQNILSREERIANLSDAFEVTPTVELPEKVLLIDDVTTSGTTFSEAASILKKSGVQTVWCLAFARGK